MSQGVNGSQGRVCSKRTRSEGFFFFKEFIEGIPSVTLVSTYEK